MENNKEHHIERTNFDAFVHAVGSEIEQAQVRLITAANAQMLFHYWKMGNYILYHQNLQGWGSKIIKQLAKAIRFNYPEKKGYSERNLTYMCQFARSYPLNVLRSFIDTDARLSVPSIQNVTDEVLKLNNGQFTQELTAQIQSTDSQLLEFTQEPLAQIQNVAKTVSAIYRITIEDIEKLFLASPVARINWASHVIMLNNSLPLGVKYWYMKQSVEMGWSSNVLKIFRGTVQIYLLHHFGDDRHTGRNHRVASIEYLMNYLLGRCHFKSQPFYEGRSIERLSATTPTGDKNYKFFLILI